MTETKTPWLCRRFGHKIVPAMRYSTSTVVILRSMVGADEFVCHRTKCGWYDPIPPENRA